MLAVEIVRERHFWNAHLVADSAIASLPLALMSDAVQKKMLSGSLDPFLEHLTEKRE